MHEVIEISRIILDLCGGTGSWSKPYKDAGYDVRLIDPLHDGTDVRLFEISAFELMNEKIYGILAAPPCTHFASSGARWWPGKGSQALQEGLSVVDACLRIIAVTQPVFWALENPIGRLKKYIGNPVMYFNPCDYGDPYTKRTCLWGKFNVPKQTPVKPTEGSKMHRLPPGPDRWRLRSMTPQGFARAFFEANQ
jgi:site-specific DNA-cytosine methylase